MSNSVFRPISCIDYGYVVGQVFRTTTEIPDVLGVNSLIQLKMDDHTLMPQFIILQTTPLEDGSSEIRYTIGDLVWYELVNILPASPEEQLRGLIGVTT
jgi:hypothetical protein